MCCLDFGLYTHDRRRGGEKGWVGGSGIQRMCAEFIYCSYSASVFLVFWTGQKASQIFQLCSFFFYSFFSIYLFIYLSRTSGLLLLDWTWSISRLNSKAYRDGGVEDGAHNKHTKNAAADSVIFLSKWSLSSQPLNFSSFPIYLSSTHFLNLKSSFLYKWILKFLRKLENVSTVNRKDMGFNENN